MEEQNQRAIIFFDFPNFLGTMQTLGDVRVSFSNFLKEVVAGGAKIVAQKVFYDEAGNNFAEANTMIKVLKDLGFELIPVPKKIYHTSGQANGLYAKSRTDQPITIHLMKHLMRDEFDLLIFFSGDSDYEFVLKEIIANGKKVLIFSSAQNLASNIVEIEGINVILLEHMLNTDLIYHRQPKSDKNNPAGSANDPPACS